VQLDHLDIKENMEIPEFMELQEYKARKDNLDLQDLWVLLD
jgi:hypothetical protein